MLQVIKQLTMEQLADERQKLRQAHKTLVVTNGCFDLLHAGHVYSLERAAQQGDVLWVGVNSDKSVQALKGIKRPIYPQEQRLYLVGALQCVQGVFLFEGSTCTSELQLIQPDVYVKSGGYTLETLNPDERRVLEAAHTRIVFLPPLPGLSTTHTIQSIQEE